jgi:mannan endo-1,4-beta-mannosidase
MTADPSTTGFVARNGSNLFIDGHPYRFAGVTANELATYWSVNWGCGSQVGDLDAFFASLPPRTMISFTATQAMAFNNKSTQKLDFTGIDRVVYAAERHDDKLTISLSSQGGACDDGHWKDKAWYDGGYKQVFDDDGRNLSRMSYWDYVRLVVFRYRYSPAVAIWQPVGEPEASNCDSGFVGGVCYARTCPAGATSSLRNFFDTIGAEIKRFDRKHLVGTGVLSRRQCGLSGGGYQKVLESPYVDVANYHDYGFESLPLPPDLKTALEEARAAKKVFVMDEGGINAGPPCETTTQRRDRFKAKMDAQLSAGAAGFQAWNWVPMTDGGCEMTIGPGDPFIGLLRTYRVPS